MKSAHFTIKKLGVQDLATFQKLIRLFREIFEMEDPEAATESYLQDLLAKPGFIVYAALHENGIAGGLTAYELPIYYSGYSEVYIYDIAVSPEYSRWGSARN